MVHKEWLESAFRTQCQVGNSLSSVNGNCWVSVNEKHVHILHALMSISHVLLSPSPCLFLLLPFCFGGLMASTPHIISHQKTMQLLTVLLDLLDMNKSCTSLSEKCTLIHSSEYFFLALSFTHSLCFTNRTTNKRTCIHIYICFHTGAQSKPLKLFARK